jgi:hypothetical protein
MDINLSFDPSVTQGIAGDNLAAAPAGFEAAIEAAATVLDSDIRDPTAFGNQLFSEIKQYLADWNAAQPSITIGLVPRAVLLSL